MTTAIASKQLPLRTKTPFPIAVVAKAKAPSPVPADKQGPDLDEVGTAHVVPRGKTVAEEGAPAEYVFRIVSGAFRMVRLLPDGRRSVIDFLLPGDYFGLAENGTYSHSLEVISDASFIRYPKEQLRRLLDSDPRASRRFFNLMCEQLSAAQGRLLMLSRKSAVERIASFILAMADRSQRKDGAIKLPMNRADVADYLGLTIETVSRTLSQLKTEKLIELPTACQIVLRDRDRLAAISGDN